MRIRKLWVVAGLAVMLALAGAGVVVAQTTEDGSGTFLDRVARRLGIEPEKLEQAIEDTRKEDIDAAVARGDITQEQADRLKERIEGGDWPAPFQRPPFPLFPPFEPGEGQSFRWDHEFPGPGGPHRFGFSFGIDFPKQLEDLAGFLGINSDQLREELSVEGATLAKVAEAHGKTRDELKAFLAQKLQEPLDNAVEDGDLPQDAADDMKARIDEMLDKIIDGQLGLGRGHGGFGFKWKYRSHDGGDPDSGSPVPQSGTGREEGRS